MNILARLDLTVSQVRPLFYIGAYVCAIPFFGAFYTWWTPHGFYAPYAQFEPSADSDTWIIKGILNTAFSREIEAHPAADSVIGETTFSSVVDVRELKVSPEKDVSFYLFIGGRGKKDEYWRWTKGSVCHLVVEGSPKVSDEESEYFLIRSPISCSGTLTEYQIRSVCKLLAWPTSPDVTNFYALRLLSNESDEFQRYVSGISGDPTRLSSSYPRMIYLSAVIITTLGLGDIVPISGPARSLVASEAVFGILVAGLFLNSLAYRASQRP